MKPFVAYWNNIPAPYMVERFNALHGQEAFEFEAWFNDRIESDRSWVVDESTWRFRYRYLPSIELFGKNVHVPIPVFGRKPDLLVSLHWQPVFIAGWMIARLRGSLTAFRVLKTFDTWIHRSTLKERMKHFLFRRVDAIETAGEDGKAYAMLYGVRPEQIFITTHAFDVEHFYRGHAAALSDRERKREQLGLRGVTFIYVGRLWPGKGVGYLLEAFEQVQQEIREEVSLLIVGDGPQEEELKRRCSSLEARNVIFAGFQPRAQLPEFYALADVFVFPTLGDPYGLVVDEAMACSLPVISTREAGEIDVRVEEGCNGYLIPPADPQSMADRMLALAQDAEARTRMGKRSRALIEGHTPERWAGDFTVMVKNLLDGDAG